MRGDRPSQEPRADGRQEAARAEPVCARTRPAPPPRRPRAGLDPRQESPRGVWGLGLEAFSPRWTEIRGRASLFSSTLRINTAAQRVARAAPLTRFPLENAGLRHFAPVRAVIRRGAGTGTGGDPGWHRPCPPQTNLRPSPRGPSGSGAPALRSRGAFPPAVPRGRGLQTEWGDTGLRDRGLVLNPSWSAPWRCRRGVGPFL